LVTAFLYREFILLFFKLFFFVFWAEPECFA